METLIKSTSICDSLSHTRHSLSEKNCTKNISLFSVDFGQKLSKYRKEFYREEANNESEQKISKFYNNLQKKLARRTELILIDEIIRNGDEVLYKDIYELMPKMIGLKILILNNQEIGTLYYRYFCYALGYLKNLEKLSVANSKLDKIDNFEELSDSLCLLPRLLSLNLSDNCLNSEQIKDIFSCSFVEEGSSVFTFLHKLRVLNLSLTYREDLSADLSTIDVNMHNEYLLLMSSLTLIKELYLCGRNLTGSMRILKTLLNSFTNLKILDLSNNSLSKVDIRTLFSFSTADNISYKLEELFLANNRISNDGFASLIIALARFPRLIKLDVSKNYIQEIKLFNHAIPKTMKVLNLNGNPLAKNNQDFAFNFDQLNTY